MLDPLTHRASETSPSVLIFDVNETLIDLTSLNPFFARLFGDERVMREWFGQLVLYSMAVSSAELYEDFFSLGQGVLQMVGALHGVKVTPDDLADLRARMLTMPAHADVAHGLQELADAGFRLVTLTNSPPNGQGKSPLENAGLARHFERQFSVDSVRVFKPSPHVYRLVSQALDVPPAACCLVAAHVWDTIGAQALGMSGALLTRPGNALLPVPGLPQPNFVAPDLARLAEMLIAASAKTVE
jgi:2-haloacid dehalogenase